MNLNRAFYKNKNKIIFYLFLLGGGGVSRWPWCNSVPERALNDVDFDLCGKGLVWFGFDLGSLGLVVKIDKRESSLDDAWI